MKVLMSAMLGLAVVFALALTSKAAEEKAKEVTLKGTITCGKCDLKEVDKCHTVIKVKKDGKDLVYWFDEKGSKKFHKEICTTPKPGSATGTVSEKDGKQWITVTKVEFE